MKNFDTHQIKDFDLFFSFRDTELSIIIRAVDGGDFSHCGHFRVIDKEIFAVDAQKDGYKRRNLVDWCNEYEYNFIVLRKPLTANKIKSMRINERINLFKKYNKFALVKQFFVRIIERLIGRELNVTTTSRKLYCSKALMLVLGAKKTDLTPNEAYTYCMDHGYEIEMVNFNNQMFV